LHLCVAHPLASTTSLQQPCRRFKCACVKHLRACTHARVCLGCAPDIFPLVLGHFQGGQDADASTLSLLPPGLRTEGLKHLHASAFVTVPMFKHTGKYDAFWRSLLERAEVRPSTLCISCIKHVLDAKLNQPRPRVTYPLPGHKIPRASRERGAVQWMLRIVSLVLRGRSEDSMAGLGADALTL
jgi:hypothetical protein